MPTSDPAVVQQALALGGYLCRCDILEHMKAFYTNQGKEATEIWLTPAQELLLQTHFDEHSPKVPVRDMEKVFACQPHFDAENFRLA